MKNLICGCCGRCFERWNGYKNQDQDRGFGICAGCQDTIAGHEKSEMDKAITLLADNLNSTNAEKFAGLDRTTQEYLVMDAIDNDILTFTIKPRPVVRIC